MRESFRKHPERRKEREGEPDLPLGVGDPPTVFDAAQAERWKALAELGKTWLVAADGPLLEEAAKLWAEGRRAKLSSADGKRYDKLLGDLGFGPIARTRIKQHTKPDSVDAMRKKYLG